MRTDTLRAESGPGFQERSKMRKNLKPALRMLTGLLAAATVFGSVCARVQADETETRAPQETAAGSEVYLDKYLTPNGKTANGNPEYTVTLEQYVTGEQPEMAAKYPTDIVLVLDYSSSMGAAMTDGRHRWYGVAEGARSFLDSVAAENETREDDLKMRVAVVGYNNSVWTDSSFVTVTQESKETLKAKLIPNEDSNTNGVAERLKDNTRTDLALVQADSLSEFRGVFEQKGSRHHYGRRAHTTGRFGAVSHYVVWLPETKQHAQQQGHWSQRHFQFSQWHGIW